jgi:hypothetical protein
MENIFNTIGKVFGWLFTPKTPPFMNDTQLNPFDDRDITPMNAPTATAVNMTDPIIDPLTAVLPILNQFQIPDCTCENVKKMMQRWYFEKTGKIIDFSERYLWIKSVQWMKANNYSVGPTIGTFPRVPMGIAVSWGCCTTAMLPNDATLSYADYTHVVITPAMDAEAALYKMPAYKTYGSDNMSLRLALTECKCIGITLPVGNFYGAVVFPPVSNLGAPLHRLSMYGDVPDGTENHDLFANSWGTGFGNAGFQSFNFSAFNGKIYDVMGFVDVPAPIIQVITTQKKMQNRNLQLWCAAAQIFEGWEPSSNSWGKNNPGNIKFVGQALATNTGPENGSQFCTFKTYEDGYTTLYQMLSNACSGLSRVYTPSMTILQFYQKYTSDGSVVSQHYAEFVARVIGVSVDTPISALIK